MLLKLLIYYAKIISVPLNMCSTLLILQPILSLTTATYFTFKLLNLTPCLTSFQTESAFGVKQKYNFKTFLCVCLAF